MTKKKKKKKNLREILEEFRKGPYKLPPWAGGRFNKARWDYRNEGKIPKED